MIFSLIIIGLILLKGLKLRFEGFLKSYMLLEDISSSQAKDINATILGVLLLSQNSLHMEKVLVYSRFL